MTAAGTRFRYRALTGRRPASGAARAAAALLSIENPPPATFHHEPFERRCLENASRGNFSGSGGPAEGLLRAALPSKPRRAEPWGGRAAGPRGFSKAAPLSLSRSPAPLVYCREIRRGLAPAKTVGRGARPSQLGGRSPPPRAGRRGGAAGPRTRARTPTDRAARTPGRAPREPARHGTQAPGNSPEGTLSWSDSACGSTWLRVSPAAFERLPICWASCELGGVRVACLRPKKKGCAPIVRTPSPRSTRSRRSMVLAETSLTQIEPTVSTFDSGRTEHSGAQSRWKTKPGARNPVWGPYPGRNPGQGPNPDGVTQYGTIPRAQSGAGSESRGRNPVWDHTASAIRGRVQIQMA